MTPDFRNLRTDFHNFIEPFSKTFNEFLAGDLAREIRKNSADAQLAEAIIYCLKSGGKRLRPALFFLCAGLRESQIQETVATATPFCRLATALEMFHTYTLVHDDLPSMDNADTRRGLPSCHKKYSQWLAILVGDALNTLAFQQLAQSCYADAAAKDADADADGYAQAAAAKDATAIDADGGWGCWADRAIAESSSLSADTHLPRSFARFASGAGSRSLRAKGRLFFGPELECCGSALVGFASSSKEENLLVENRQSVCLQLCFWGNFQWQCQW